MDDIQHGRGSRATSDMKARIKALQRQGDDVLGALWERHYQALYGEGYRYEYAEEAAEPVRPARH